MFEVNAVSIVVGLLLGGFIDLLRLIKRRYGHYFATHQHPYKTDPVRRVAYDLFCVLSLNFAGISITIAFSISSIIEKCGIPQIVAYMFLAILTLLLADRAEKLPNLNYAILASSLAMIWNISSLSYIIYLESIGIDDRSVLAFSDGVVSISHALNVHTAPFFLSLIIYMYGSFLVRSLRIELSRS